jgi:BlaI family transcriptional regulator, penicillinase repressor
MKKRAHVRPTDGELEILRVLWSRGPCGVGKVHKVLSASKGTTYNTTLKLLQVMLEKGLVTRDDSDRPQIYQAAVPENQTQRHLVADLLDRAFGGSARKLVAALAAGDIPKDEMAKIRRLLDSHKEGKR